MVDVVVPLRGAVSPAPTFVARQVARLVAVVLQHQVDMPLVARPVAHRGAEFLDDVRCAVVADGVDGIQAQAVESGIPPASRARCG